MVRLHRLALVVAVALLLVTAGCSGSGQNVSAGDGGDPQATPAAGERERQADEAGPAAQPRPRAIIRTGEVQVEVPNFETARSNLTRSVRQLGGFVSDSRVEVNTPEAGTYRSGMLVLRVPSENFSAMMTAARAVGTVESASTQSEDVTDQLVDLEARLENLRAERDRLRALYRNATDTDDVLDIEERLSEVQGEIERLEAQQAQLERQVALSTIRVDLHEPRPEPGPLETSQWYDRPVFAAFLDSVNGVVVTLRAIVVAIAYLLPYLLVFGPVALGAAYAVTRSDAIAARVRPRE